MNIKQAIIDRLRATKRANIEKVIEYMEKHGFFTYHCHRHHHYEGGLADHAWQTYQIAIRIDEERCAQNPNNHKLDKDSLAICALLHDICDCSGMRYIDKHKLHGLRSAVMLKELGFHMSQDEFLAIRFHMSLKDKKNHPFYNDALKNQLRYVVHKADSTSASINKGYNDPCARQAKRDLQPFLQNITKLECKNIIYEVLYEGWFLNPHSPYDGNIEPEWIDRIIDVKEYNSAELFGINDSMIGAIYVLDSGNKKALFTLHHYHGMQGACYFSPDKDPFIYSEIKVYHHCTEWNDYGYAACKQANGWKLVKVTQFPMPEYTVIGEGFSTAEEAMKSIGIEYSDKYLYKGII